MRDLGSIGHELRVFGDILLVCMCLRCVKIKFLLAELCNEFCTSLLNENVHQICFRKLLQLQQPLFSLRNLVICYLVSFVTIFRKLVMVYHALRMQKIEEKDE